MDIANDADRLQMLLYSAYDSDTVRDMERPLLDDGTPLMRMAASAAAQVTMTLLDDEDLAVEDARITVLAGAGDNGGDGLYAGAILAREGAQVTAIATGRSLHDGAFAAFVHAGGRVLVLDPNAEIPGCATGFSAGEAGERLQAAVEYAQGSHVVLDAMTGIGVSGALRSIPGTIAASLGLTSRLPDRPALPNNEPSADLPLVVAVDTPSGVGVNDGSLPGAYIPADVTVMFGAMKPCAMVPPASYACGKLVLVDFGFDIDGTVPAVEMTDGDFVADAIRLPRLSDGKYSRGVVGLVTGSARYPGAAVLTAKAAARTDTGMVRYMGPQRAQDMVLAALPEAVIGKGHVQSWVVGSGVPSGDDRDDKDIQRDTIEALLRHYAMPGDTDGTGGDERDASDAAAMPPIAVDAGALDLLPDHVPHQVVITPHAGELARLLNRLHGEDADGEPVDASDVQAEPLRYATMAHELTGATVLLKGAVTIVVGADGDGGDRVILSGRAPAWLGTAGAGDVLAGMLGALLAQQDGTLPANPSFIPEIAAAAAYMHGLAAAVASGSEQRGWHRPELYGHTEKQRFSSIGHPIVATDVIDAIPQMFDELIR
ncbi:bifunctional ADP-dependent NAD(P)H-hydrate dehydratase/NAD(P)H-hydrate epimerase [Bifidobacterium sp. 64T4]|uniref:bifunctional ADP-dependent NAD(P)H-hydrate dehydratase/NAD(P)H-hydrate epimerase n=1 Tax=Bifidobacterium pongonis TaxID=2834432 RepID=UPI001C5839EE|nr:bifunctional ADP-dependent NAD(P)H-hydrate dehydratase/NAD(P)H-hydrate epimerase [Bifidobacterium pongonis]MBW3094127.1 bifunctional ADP-dependent NAD(P)H-hydrate dehydratase/NAD(P)H-hydrate epimerase [Bifidobacterium pongonis]